MRTPKTHCIRGHALAGDNLYHPPKAPHKNLCRACIKIRGDARGPHLPKPCRDCGADIPHTGRRPPLRCAPCADAHHRRVGAEAMRKLRASGYRPEPKERRWTPEQRERFWSRVNRGADCWEWKALTSPSGYGVFDILNVRLQAHRASWEMTNGPIPDGLVVRHDCDNPPCVRPDHLRLGTPKDNAMDAVERQRHPRGDQHWTRRTPRRRDELGRWAA